MKRRQFVAASLLAGLTPAAFPASSRAAEKPAKELYELRFFKLASPEKAAVMEDFFQQAAIPVWNRLGIGPVGVFKMLDGKDPGLYVLLPHKSLESVVTLSAKMAADRAFLQAGAAVFDAPPKDPAYLRMQSSLLLAFDGMPKLEVPTTKDTRILQLRIYESPGLWMARRKLEMFNTAGEMAIFRRAGMTAVFFGEAIISDRMPHLTYMLGFDDQAALDKAWAAFKADPEWLKLKARPEYLDTVSNITNILLRPAKGSQI